jgi:glycine/D-amino acid oxidase-like deaminating enzyme
LKTKVCFYDMTENSDFVLDSDPDNNQLVYGYGFSGHGFKFAPLIGKLLAELALDMKPSTDIKRFSAIPSRRHATGTKNFSLWQSPLGKGRQI